MFQDLSSFSEPRLFGHVLFCRPDHPSTKSYVAQTGSCLGIDVPLIPRWAARKRFMCDGLTMPPSATLPAGTLGGLCRPQVQVPLASRCHDQSVPRHVYTAWVSTIRFLTILSILVSGPGLFLFLGFLYASLSDGRLCGWPSISRY